MATFLNAAVNRAERRQQPIELSISPRENRLWLDSNEAGFTRELKMTDGIIIEAVLTGTFEKAYLVLGGEGWKLRTFYVDGGLKEHLVHADKVAILTLEGFVARANQGKL